MRPGRVRFRRNATEAGINVTNFRPNADCRAFPSFLHQLDGDTILPALY
jgi:hypothetical protein